MLNFADRHAQVINDPNFLWILLGQVVLGLTRILIFGWFIHKLILKLMPKSQLWKRFVIVIILLILFVSFAGIVSEYFD